MDWLVKVLIDFEQENYPFFEVIEISIISINNGVVKYQPKVCSRIDKKWQMWKSRKEINVSELKELVRDEKINLILSDLSQDY